MKKIHDGSYKLAQLLLIKLRKSNGLTQVELANNLGVDQSFISKVERGERRLDIVEFIFYCNALKTPPEQAITDLQKNIEGRH